MWPDQRIDELSKQRIVSKTPLKRIGDPEDIALRCADYVPASLRLTFGDLVFEIL